MTTIVGKISVFLLAENRLLREALAKILNKKNRYHCGWLRTSVIGSCVKNHGVVAPGAIVQSSPQYSGRRFCYSTSARGDR